jgi:hypothetical protein
MFMFSFKTPTSLQLATNELAEAKVRKLIAETALDWAVSNVAYQNTRIVRLVGIIKEEQAAEQLIVDSKTKYKATNE